MFCFVVMALVLVAGRSWWTMDQMVLFVVVVAPALVCCDPAYFALSLCGAYTCSLRPFFLCISYPSCLSGFIKFCRLGLERKQWRLLMARPRNTKKEEASTTMMGLMELAAPLRVEARGKRKRSARTPDCKAPFCFGIAPFNSSRPMAVYASQGRCFGGACRRT